MNIFKLKKLLITQRKNPAQSQQNNVKVSKTISEQRLNELCYSDYEQDIKNQN